MPGILKSLSAWAARQPERLARIAGLFGGDAKIWNEELVLQRYELLYEAQLVPEAARGKPIGDPLPPVSGNRFQMRPI